MKGDIEDVKHAVAMRLSGPTLLAVLSAVDTEKGAATPTPGPTAVYEGEKANPSEVGFPICEVIGHRTTYADVDEVTKTATHELEITWTQVGDDELAITTHLERLVRATRDLFWPATGPIVLPEVNSQPVQLLSEEYTALMPARLQPFVKASATVLHVTTLSL